MPLGAEDIEALATALQGLQPESATVNAKAVKLPPFWSGNLSSTRFYMLVAKVCVSRVW